MDFDVFLHDSLNPEDNAMLQALYSRSSSSVKDHLEKVDERGSSSFMKKYYVGYGHSSIADCGTTTLFIENVSLLACKAIQDNPLYSGQETSTRYISFSEQKTVDPVGTKESREVLKRWIKFYKKCKKPLKKYLKSNNPKKEPEDKKVWKKAIDARCFDIMRGFLPAGVTSQLSWSTNLRQARDKLKEMRHHPLKEVRNISFECHKILRDKYPSSFDHKRYDKQESYLESTSLRSNYLLPEEIDLDKLPFNYEKNIDNKELEKKEKDVISKRPKGAELPRYLSQYGRYKCTFELDYGTFRDIQRHRNGLCRIPILSDELPFHKWYLMKLPESIQNKARSLIDKQISSIQSIRDKNDVTREKMQYYYPLGIKVPCQVVYSLPQIVYVTELRSKNTVHPTLRNIAHKFHKMLTYEHPNLKLYTDLKPDRWDIKRGKQDIEKKPAK